MLRRHESTIRLRVGTRKGESYKSTSPLRIPSGLEGPEDAERGGLGHGPERLRPGDYVAHTPEPAAAVLEGLEVPAE